jgi:hypothetical protein
MRGISKTMLRTCAGLAVAAGLVVGGAGVASAATTSPTTHSSSSYGFYCNPFAREQWNLNGSNTVNAVYQGTTYSYSITFRQYGSCLFGTMTDPYFPTTGPIHGTIYGNYVTFSFTYPRGSIQGTRTFNGYIHPVYYRQWYKQWYWNGYRWVYRWRIRFVFHSGSLSGNWSETGSEQGSGTFSLANPVSRT